METQQYHHIKNVFLHEISNENIIFSLLFPFLSFFLILTSTDSQLNIISINIYLYQSLSSSLFISNIISSSSQSSQLPQHTSQRRLHTEPTVHIYFGIPRESYYFYGIFIFPLSFVFSVMTCSFVEKMISNILGRGTKSESLITLFSEICAVVSFPALLQLIPDLLVALLLSIRLLSNETYQVFIESQQINGELKYSPFILFGFIIVLAQIGTTFYRFMILAKSIFNGGFFKPFLFALIGTTLFFSVIAL